MTTAIPTHADLDERAWNYARYRWSLLAAALVNPVWALLYSQFSDVYDPLWQRLVTSFVFLGFVGLTYVPRDLGSLVPRLFTTLVCLFTAHMLFLTAMNELNLLYILGVYCTMFASGAILLTPRSLSIYYTFCIGMTLAIWWHMGDAKSVFLLMGAISSLAVTFVSSRVILSLLRALQSSRQDLAQANSELENVMNSLGQGFFSFGPDGVCKRTYSQACVRLLEKIPAGQNIWDVLGGSPAEREDCSRWVQICFDPSFGLMESMLDIAQKEFTHSAGLRVSFAYYPVMDGDRLLEMVVVATDRTEEFRAKHEAQVEQRRATMIASIVEQRSLFQPFLGDLRKSLRDYAIRGAPDLEFKRFLHTIKAAFATFAMDDLSALTHELEAAWTSPGATLARDQASLLSGAIGAFVDQYRAVLGRTVTDQTRTVEMPLPRLLELIGKPDLGVLRSELISSALRPIGEFFRPHQATMRDIAATQDKLLNELVLVNEGVLIYPEPYLELFGAMAHVFRNAVDHGLEDVHERALMGKDPKCTVEVHFAQTDGAIQIAVRDDGRGINPSVLRARIRPGLEAYRDASDAEVLQMIFEPGLSTRDNVTAISGRGVGLDAVKAAAVALGGQARVRSVVGQGTELVVTIPVRLPRVDVA